MHQNSSLSEKWYLYATFGYLCRGELNSLPILHCCQLLSHHHRYTSHLQTSLRMSAIWITRATCVEWVKITYLLLWKSQSTLWCVPIIFLNFMLCNAPRRNLRRASIPEEQISRILSSYSLDISTKRSEKRFGFPELATRKGRTGSGEE